MTFRAHQLIFCAATAATLIGATLPAAAQANMTCAQIQQECYKHVMQMQISQAEQKEALTTCNRYFATSQKTGVWPAYKEYQAMACQR